MTERPTDEEPLAGDPRGRRIAQAEINGRRVNEAIQRGREDDELAVFVCECGTLGCATTLELRLSEYEDVRTSFERFVVVPGHEIPDIEDVVERRPGYTVVAKRGEAATLARQDDPRTDAA
jgi:hypothetical protein